MKVLHFTYHLHHRHEFISERETKIKKDSSHMHRLGNDFSFGGSKNWTTFSVWKHKVVINYQDNQTQCITLNTTYFSKKVYAVYNGVWGNFCVRSNLTVTLQSVRLLLTVSYRKMGEQDVLVARPIILLGRNCSSAPLVTTPMVMCENINRVLRGSDRPTWHLQPPLWMTR